MKKAYALVAVLVLVLAVAASYFLVNPKYPSVSDLAPYVKDIPCGGAAQCPEGYSCINIPPSQPGIIGGVNLFCATNEFVSNPCKYYKCPIFKKCMVLELYPPSIHCG
jgi:hypothetical protein